MTQFFSYFNFARKNGMRVGLNICERVVVHLCARVCEWESEQEWESVIETEERTKERKRVWLNENSRKFAQNKQRWKSKK